MPRFEVRDVRSGHEIDAVHGQRRGGNSLSFLAQFGRDDRPY
jgi:hypothetical protein